MAVEVAEMEVAETGVDTEMAGGTAVARAEVAAGAEVRPVRRMVLGLAVSVEDLSAQPRAVAPGWVLAAAVARLVGRWDPPHRWAVSGRVR